MAKTAANPRSGTKPKTAASKTTPTKATTPKKSRPSALTKRTPPTKFSFGTGMVGTSGSGADSSVVASGGVLKARFAVVGTTAFHKELTDNGWAGGGGVMLCWSGTAGMDNEKLSVFFRLLIDALADGNGSSFSEQVKAGKTHHRMKLPSGNVKYPLGNNMMCTRRGVGAYDVAVEVYSKKHAQDIWSAVAEAFAEDAAAQKHFTIMPTIPSDIAMPSSESWDDMARVLVGASHAEHPPPAPMCTATPPLTLTHRPSQAPSGTSRSSTGKRCSWSRARQSTATRRSSRARECSASSWTSKSSSPRTT